MSIRNGILVSLLPPVWENTGMNKSRLAQSIEKLMEQHKIASVAELANLCGMHQPTLHRIMSGESKEPRDSSLQPLAAYFRVTVAQLKGADFWAPENPDTHLTTKAIKLARKWDALPPNHQKTVSDLIDALSQTIAVEQSAIK